MTNRLKTNPQMTAMAAELIRDGLLEKILSGKTLEKAAAGAMMLPSTMRKWRSLKIQLALRILRGILGKDKHQEVLEALQQEDMENGLAVNLVKWALGVETMTPCPRSTASGVWRRHSSTCARRGMNNLAAVCCRTVRTPIAPRTTGTPSWLRDQARPHAPT